MGIDGRYWYRLRLEEPTESQSQYVSVESNGSEQDFRSFLRLDWDAKEIGNRIVQMGPELAPYVTQFEGLRVLRSNCPYETFFSFLCTPNNNILRIKQMVRQLAEYGEPIGEVGGVVLKRFPSPEVIAEIPEADLRTKGFGYRAATIPTAARQLLGWGSESLEKLKSVSYEEAHSTLWSVKGIGPKLADCIALFGLDHTEAVPIDTHVWQALVRLYYPEMQGKALTDSRYLEMSKAFRTRFGAYSGWAQQVLFYENMVRWRDRKT